MKAPGSDGGNADISLSVFNLILSPAFVMDDDSCVVFWNSPAEKIAGRGDVIMRRGGEILPWIHSTDV